MQRFGAAKTKASAVRFEYAISLVKRREIRALTIAFKRYTQRKFPTLRSALVDDSFSLVLPRVSPIPDTGPLVDIVVPHVNYSDFLGRCLASLKAQTFQRFKVLVVESGSDAHHRDAAMRIVAELNDERFSIEAVPLNTLGANRNFGISRGDAPFLLCIDPDDTLSPDYLEHAVWLALRGDFDVVAASAMLRGQESGIWRVPYPVVKARAFAYRNAIPSNALFRRSLWQSVGGFEDVIYRGKQVHEDWWFWILSLVQDAKIAGIHEPLSTLEIHGRNMSRSSKVLTNEEQVLFHRSRIGRLKLPKKHEAKRSTGDIHGILGAFDEGPLLIVTAPFIPRAGATKVIERITRGLKELGWTIKIITFEEEQERHRAADEDFPHATVLRLNRLFPKWLWSSYINDLAQGKRAVLWNVGSQWVHANARQIRLPKVDTQFVEGSQPYESLCKHHQDFAQIVAEGNALSLTLSKRCARTIIVIPNGVDSVPVRTSLRDPIVIWAGRLAPEKDPHRFVRVAAKVYEHLPETHFLLLGDGDLYGPLKRYIARNRVPIKLLGHIDTIGAYLAQARVFVSTSTELEGRPNVILEALSHGVPVVAPPVGAVPEIVVDNVTGFLCSGDDDIVKAVKTLLTIDESEWSRFSQASVTIASKNSWEDSVMRYHGVFLAVVRESERPASGREI